MNKKPIPPLRSIREKKKKTIEEVAAAIGIDESTLSQIERGKRGITPRVAEKLVGYYGRRKITEMKLLYPERFFVTAA